MPFFRIKVIDDKIGLGGIYVCVHTLSMLVVMPEMCIKVSSQPTSSNFLFFLFCF